jgi:lipopolysaccharide/colanic/teichoic acid biosynthesis glycosyltransferase
MLAPTSPAPAATPQVIAPPPARVGHVGYDRAKRLFDLCVGSLMLLVAAPVVLLAWALVRLTSRGPGFYSQARVGRFGEPFVILKLRTMSHDCEATSGVRWATRHDPRVTPVGRVLRRLHVDELSQLLNVLRGDMSLVGPRPERPEFVGPLSQALPGYADRLRVRPGLTGLAQVQLPPDEDVTSVRHKVVYDLYYVRRQGLLLDVRLVLATVLKTLGGKPRLIRRACLLPGRDAVAAEFHRALTPAAGVPQFQPA